MESTQNTNFFTIIFSQLLNSIWRLEQFKPNETQLENTKLLLVVKFLHELQHRATRLFLDLRAPSRSLRSTASQKHTPENVGSMMFRGKASGDSGYALEEVLLGGRLRHRHLVKGGLFFVS